MGEGRDDMNETATNHGDFGEETEGGKDLHGRTKIKTEPGPATRARATARDGAMGAGLDNKNETITNHGDFHQAKTKATSSDFEGTGDEPHQAENKADTEARTRPRQRAASNRTRLTSTRPRRGQGQGAGEGEGGHVQRMRPRYT